MTCEQCGTHFEPRRRRAVRFCRATCRARWHAAKKVAAMAELSRLVARMAALISELENE
jgi:hypothetical protein